MPNERQIQLVKGNIRIVSGASSEIPWSISSTVSNSVLAPDAVYRLLVSNITTGQSIPPKLALCLQNILNMRSMGDPSAITSEDSSVINAFLGQTPVCERCRSANNSCKVKELSTASFAEIEAAAMDNSQQQCFSEVRRLFFTRLAQEGEHQNLEKLQQMANNGQREAQAVLLAQKLDLLNFPINDVEKQKEYFDSFCERICSEGYSNSVESLIAKGFKYVKDDHAVNLALTSSRLSFTKALQECLSGDADMTYLAYFCQPALWTYYVDNVQNVRFFCSVTHETLLQFLIELRAAQRVKAHAVATA